jgi:hypothetical protein
LEGTPLVHWHRVHHVHVQHRSLRHCWHLHEIWEWSVRIESYWCIINRHENIIKLNVFNVFMMLFLTWWNLSQRLRFLILFFIWSFLCWVWFLLFLTFLLNKFLNIFRDLSINIRFILNVLEVFKTLIIWRLYLLSKSSLRAVWTVFKRKARKRKNQTLQRKLQIKKRIRNLNLWLKFHRVRKSIMKTLKTFNLMMFSCLFIMHL